MATSTYVSAHPRTRTLLAAPALACFLAACSGAAPGNQNAFATRSRESLAALPLPAASGAGANIKISCPNLSGTTCGNSLSTVALAAAALNAAPSGPQPNMLNWTAAHPIDWTDGDSATVGAWSTNIPIAGLFVSGQVVHQTPWSFSGYIAIPAQVGGTTKTFVVGSDDGYMLAISDGTAVQKSTYSAPRSFAYGDSAGKMLTVTFPAAGGLFPFELIYYEQAGVDGVELAWADGTKTTLPSTSNQRGFVLVPVTSLYAPDVRATMTVANLTSPGNPVAANTQLKYTTTLTDPGLVGASGLTLTTTVPSAIFASVTAGSGCSVSGPASGNYTVTCSNLSVTAGGSTAVNFTATTGALTLYTNIDLQGVVTGFATAPEIAAAVGDTVGMYLLTSGTGSAAQQAADTGNAPSSDVGASGLTDDNPSHLNFPGLAPTITGPTGNRPSAASQVVTGTSPYPNGTTVKVTATSGATTVTCTATVAGGAGAWSCPATAYGVGTWSLVAVQLDGSGATGTPSASFSMIVTAPTTPVLTGPASNALVASASVALSGTSAEAAGSTIQASVVSGGTTTSCTATVQADGTWTCNVTSLAAGTYTESAAVVEATGTLGAASSSRTFYVSATGLAAPTIAQTTTFTTTPALSGTLTAAEVGANYRLEVREGANVVCTISPTTSANWSCTSSALTQGSHTLNAYVIDGAGIASAASNNDTFTVDSIAPSAPTVTSSAGPLKTNPPALAGNGEVGATVTVKNASSVVLCTAVVQADTTWTCTPGSALGQGANALSITQKDVAGNGSGTTSFSVTIDTVAPAVALTTPAQTKTATPAITGTAEVGVSVVVKDEQNRTLCTIASVPAGGAWSCAASAFSLSEAAHTLTATATDAAGNTATASKSLTVDLTAPAIALTTPAQTKTATPAISGTSEAGAAVVVTDEQGRTVCSIASVPSGGSWSCAASAVSLSEASHTLTATATDAAGNTATATKDINVDLTPPAIALTTPAQVNSQTPAISGTSEAGAAVVVKDEQNRTVCSIASVPAGGAWSCAASAFTLSDGPHTLTATATDAAGNTATNAKSLTVDRTPPALTMPLPALTSSATPAISGTAEVGASVIVTDEQGRTLCSIASVQTGGAWSCAASAFSLTEGPHTITAVAADAAGNTTTVAKSLTVDLTPPAVSLDLLALTDLAKPALSGTAEAGASLVVTDEAGRALCTIATVASNGKWSCVSTLALGEGDHTLTATAKDAAGNTAQASQPLTVDLTPPAISLATAGLTNNPTPALSGTAEVGSSVVVKDEAGRTLCTIASVPSGGNWSCASSAVALGEGPHTLTATATDAAGNTAQASQALTVDLTPPAVSLTTATLTNSTTPAVSGTAEAGASIVVTDEAGRVLCVISSLAQAGPWSCPASAVALGEGAHTLTATATDAAGNSAQVSRGLTVDLTPPQAPVVTSSTEPTDLNPPTLTGTGEAGDLVVIKDTDGNTICSGAVGTDLTWSCTPTDKLPEGASDLTVTQIDPAGNPSPATDFTVTIDTTPPAVTLTANAPQNTATPTLSGTAEEGAMIVVRDEGGNILCATGPVGADGSWSCESTPLTDGAHTLTATATDEAGNTATSQQPILIDTQAPDAPVLAAIPGPTANTLPTFSGTAEAGSGVSVSEGGAVLCQTTAALDGSWSCQSMVALLGAPQLHTVTATSTDEAGNSTQSGPQSFVVETRTPVAPTLEAPDSPSNQPSTELDGQAQPGATVVVSDSAGHVLCTATAGADGAWSCTAKLPEGSTDLSAVTTFGTGAVSGPSEVRTVVIDTQAPDAPTLTALAGPIDTATPSLSGTGEAGDRIDVTAGGDVICTTTVDEHGNWTCGPTSALPQGGNPIVVTQTDPAGNTSGQTDGVVTVDLTPPTIALVQQTTPSNTHVDTLGGTAEAGSTVTVTDGSGNVLCTTVATDGTWACSATLPEGVTQITATATDPAGNHASAGPAAFVVDTIPPTTPTVNDQGPTADTTPSFSGTGEAGTDVVVTEDGTVLCTAHVGADGKWTCESTVELPGDPQTYPVSVTGVDAAGNTSVGTGDTTVTIDTTVPGDPTIDPLPGPSGTSTVDITGSSGPPGTTVTVTDGGGNVLCTTTAQPDGTYSCDVTLPDGSTTVTVTATTPAGVTSTDGGTTTVVVDTHAPAAPVLAAVTGPTSNATPAFSGTAEAGTTVTVSEGGTALCTALAQSDGTWSCTSSVLVGLPTTHTVTATATDAAQNTSAASNAQTFVVDTRNPAAPTLASINSPTSLANQTLSGTGQTGAVVTVTDALGHTVCTASVAADGSWFCAALLPEGVSTLAATESYGNGITSPASATITVDVETHAPPAPTLDPLPTPPGGSANTTADTTPTLTGTGTPGDTLTVTTGGQTLCTTTVRPDGTWSCESVLELPGDPPTAVVVTVTQTSPSGVTSPATTGTFTVDSRDPAAPVITPLTSPTNEHKPTMSGTGLPGATVTVVDAQGHVVCTATVDQVSTWSCVPATAFADGTYTFTATQTTPGGKTSPVSAPVTVVIATFEAPTLDQPVTPTTDRSPTLTGTAKVGSTVIVMSGETLICTTVAVASLVADPGHWSCDASPDLADGTYSLQAFEQTDAGLSTGSAIRPLVVDGTAPAAPTLNAGPTPTTDTRPVLSGTAEAGSIVTITDSTGAVICSAQATGSGSFACQPTTPLSLGDHTFTATSTDAAGNTSPQSNEASVTVVATAETVTVAILSPSDGQVFDVAPTETHGSATPGSTVTVTVSGVSQTVVADAGGLWSLSVPAGVDLSDGKYTLTARAASPSGLLSDLAQSTFFVYGPQIVRGGCSSGGLAVEWLGILMLVLVWPRRRLAKVPARKSRGALLVIGVSAVLPAAAHAQTTTSPSINLRLFTPAPGGDGFAAVTGARPPIDGEGTFEVRMWADEAIDPLVVSAPNGGGKVALIDQRLVGWLAIQAHLNGPLSLAVQLPVTLSQSGSLAALRSSSGAPAIGGGIGDLRLVPRLSILRQETFGVDLSAEANLTLPTANSTSMTGDGRWGAGFTGALGHRFDIGKGNAALDLVGNAALELRPPRQIADVKTGNELDLRMAAGFLPGAPSQWIPNRLFVELETRTWMRAAFASGSMPSEWRAGSGWCLAKGFAVDGGVGTAIGSGIGAPKARFVFGFGYSPASCRMPEREAAHVPDPMPVQQRPVRVATIAAPPPPPPAPVAPPEPAPAPAPLVVAEPPPDADGDGVPDVEDNCPSEAGPASNQGCPLKVKQLVVIRGNKVDILDKVYFSSGKAVIEKRSFKLLDQVAAVLVSHPDLSLVEVQGHTDNVGDAKKNVALSQTRAESVVRYLTTHGMTKDRLQAKGYGPEKPIAPNTTKLNKDKNRRVEFLVLETRNRTIEANAEAAESAALPIPQMPSTN